MERSSLTPSRIGPAVGLLFTTGCFGVDTDEDAIIPEAVDDGDLIWLTVLTGDNGGRSPEVEDAESWASKYEYDKIPVMIDPEQSLYDLGISGFPNDGFVWEKSIENYVKSFDKAVDYLETEEGVLSPPLDRSARRLPMHRLLLAGLGLALLAACESDDDDAAGPRRR